MRSSLQKITIPADWDTVKDVAFIEENSTFGEDLEGLLIKVFLGARKLGDALNSALGFFGINDLVKASNEEKLFALENVIRSDPVSDSYLAQLLESIFWCRFAHAEFERLVRLYCEDSSVQFLMPLSELASHLNAAACFLEETMLCVHQI